MIERAYADKRFEDAEIITELANGHRECNLHASCVVLRVISKQIGVIQQVIALAIRDSAFLSKFDVKRIYASCSRIFVAD